MFTYFPAHRPSQEVVQVIALFKNAGSDTVKLFGE